MATSEQQTRARHQLVRWASMARLSGVSAMVWMEHTEVLEYMKENELDPKLLDHISLWVWKGLDR